MVTYLSWKSLKKRKLTSSLCILSIALSVGLFLGVERLREGAREGFANTISQTDLIVGARGGSLQLLLYSVFHMGTPTNNIQYSSFKKIAGMNSIEWAIPLSLGDAYKGFRVVGTNEDFFRHYRFRGDRSLAMQAGKIFEKTFDVVLGSHVASQLKHKVGDKVFISHGIGEEGGSLHQGNPFSVVGILSPTNTPVDKAVYVTLEGLEAVHKDSSEGGVELSRDHFEVQQITSFLLRGKSRIWLLRLQRMIAEYEGEPLMAIIPGLALQELWQNLSYIENVLFLVSLCVLAVGLLGIIISLYTSLNERRREMAIFRSLGAGPFKILGLLLWESILLVGFGSLLGFGILYAGLLLLRPYLEHKFSLFLPLHWPSQIELLYLLFILIGGVVAGLVPAFKAYKNSLQDGLTIKV